MAPCKLVYGGIMRSFTELALDDLDVADEEILLSDMDDDELNGLKCSSQASAIKRGSTYVDSLDGEDGESSPGTSKSSNSLENSPTAHKWEQMEVEEAEWLGSTSDTDESVESVISRLENVYIEDRGIVVREGGFISTPLHSLKQLAGEFKESVHNEITVIQNSEGKRLIRVEIIVGAFRGVGEAFYKRLATQMAAIDVLMKVENTTGSAKVRPYAIYPGWRIKSHVCSDLLAICKRNNLKFPKYVSSTNINNPELPVYSVECLLGNETVSIGISDLSHVARKLAAYHAIEVITGVKCPLEFVSLGSACTSYKQLLEMGCKPFMSEIKKNWLLNDTIPNTESNNNIRGVDTAELDALRKDVFQHDFEETLEKRKGLTVTVEKGSKKRKVNIS